MVDTDPTLLPDHWYETVHRLTQQLVQLPSISPSSGEAVVAREVVRMLSDGDLGGIYREVGLDPLDEDAYQRSNAYAFLEGNSKRTIILLGHIDTVGTGDYGELEPWAFDPEGLAERQALLAAAVPDLGEDLAAHPGDWMFGRGVIDMKCGVATNIALVRHLARKSAAGPLPISVVLLATPDEENESAGALQAVSLLLRLRHHYGLEYIGVVNTDYTTGMYPGDPNRYIYTGTVGKLLPSFFIVGGEAHAGSPFDGFDANLVAAELIRDLSMCDDLCDQAAGQITPPPVTLHAADLKQHYDVQIPFIAHFSLNVLTFTTRPADLLSRLVLRAEASLSRILQRVDESMQRWLIAGGENERALRLLPRSGRVMTYSELHQAAVAAHGEAAVSAALSEAWGKVPETADGRERSLLQVQRLWRIGGLPGPAVVIYFAPPFYPHVKTTPSPLYEAVGRVALAHPELPLIYRDYFPFLSDMSYMRLDPETDTEALIQNMPIWEEPGGLRRPGAYSLPLQAIAQLNAPVINLGPYGRGAHQRGERTLMSYSFGILPQLIYETIWELATSSGS
jgi:arginine utilization protein RocB